MRNIKYLIQAFAIIGLISYMTIGNQGVSVATTKSDDTYKYLTLFGDAFERVREEYVEEIDDKKIIEYAINGMLTNLDPHSSYMNEEEWKNMKIDTRGEFGGLGIEVTMENGLVKVVSPIDDTPAFRAGIKAGDYISKIDDDAVMGMTLNDAVKKMRGKVRTPIDLTILRKGADKPLNINIIRDIIKIKSSKYRVEGNVGYVRITTFNQQTYKGLKDAIKNIQKELDNKLVGYVLDLRSNPGGLLHQAIKVSDAFLDKGEIVSTRGRVKSEMRRDNATPGDLAKGLPIVILIDGGSASASEIVAGALQDHKRAIIMGTQSFGKGSVQTLMTLPGDGAMRLTTARYYTPSGSSIQSKGITPDIIVEPAKILETIDTSNGLREADLKGALDKENGKDFKESKEKNKEVEGEEKKKIEDYQLTRALDLLQGISLYKETLSASDKETSSN